MKDFNLVKAISLLENRNEKLTISAQNMRVNLVDYAKFEENNKGVSFRDEYIYNCDDLHSYLV